MKLYSINPVSESSWDGLVARHTHASAFHQRGWLEALSRTYAYAPIAITSTPPGRPLENGIVLCRVSSWITGTRLVSLPFADHCEPLLNDPGEYPEFMDELRAECDRSRCSYLELRPLSWGQDSSHGLQPAVSYYYHELDLRPSLERLFLALHKNSIQRKIRRAEKEHLAYETGRSEQLLDQFFRLLLLTRKRHGLPPQPKIWFRNLIECMGDNLRIRVARKGDTPIAAMLTLHHGSCVVYKYGCSDERFHSLGGMPFLFWMLIGESKASGAEKLDFGRSDMHNHGLIAFKDRFGTTRKLLTYYRYQKVQQGKSRINWQSKAIRQLCALLPEGALSLAGRILYRHIG